MDLLTATLDGFAVPAQHNTDLADGAFRAHIVEGWPSPSFSPIIYLRPGTPSPSELCEVTTFWLRHWAALAATPCLLIPSLTARTSPPPLVGWQPDDRPLQVIVEANVDTSVQLPESAQPQIAPLDDAQAAAAFLHAVSGSFPDIHKHPDRVLQQLRAANGTSELLVLRYGPAQEPVAASAWTVRGETAFHTWGTVLDPYRGLRLSRGMQQAASRRCLHLGASISVTVTRNPRVTGSRPHLDMWIYRAIAGAERR